MKIYSFGVIIISVLLLGQQNLKALYSHSGRPTGDYNSTCKNITVDVREMHGVTSRIISAECRNSNNKYIKTSIVMPLMSDNYFDIILTNENGALKIAR